MHTFRKLLSVGLFLWPLSLMAVPPVNINTADADSLVEGLEGIGPQKAMAIIQYRQKNGPFQQVNDLAKVTGIGQKTVEQNRGNITVDIPKLATP